MPDSDKTSFQLISSDDVNTEMNGAEEGYVQLESIRYFDDTDNIRKSLGVGNGTIPPEKQDASDEDLRYGCACFRPSWLQGLNNIQAAVAFISLANCFQGMANGLLGVMLSTIEKRFDLASTQSSWIASAYELGPIPILILIAYFGNRIHRPLSIAFGLLTVSVGCVVFFMPQFTTSDYDPRAVDGIEVATICRYDNASKQSPCDGPEGGAESLSYYLPVFIVGRLIIGMGSTPILSLGVTYMDDMSTKEKFATYAGIYNAMSIVGPAIAYVAGGFILEIFIDFYKINPDELGFGSSDPRWLGAWWLPYILAMIMCLLNAVPMFGYRRDLPGAAEIRRNKITEAHMDEIHENPSELQYTKSFSEFKVEFKSLFTNPTFLFLTVYTFCDNFIIAGFTAFGPKFLQYGFSMSASMSGLLFGVVLLPAGAGGTIIGGLLIEKTKMSCLRILRILSVLSVLVTISTVLLLVTCNVIPFAGVNVAYNSSDTSGNFDVVNTCNVDCGCQDVLYDPICSHENIQYFSACHAGCSNVTTVGTRKEYYNCTCIPQSSDSALQGSSDTCTMETCPGAIAFLSVFFLSVGAIFIGFTMCMSATMRVVHSSQTSFAIGVQVIFIKIFGMMPGPIFFGLAFDATCNLWLYNCGVRTSCMSYVNTDLALNLFIICFVVKAIGTVGVIIGTLLYKPPKVGDASMVLEVDQQTADVEKEAPTSDANSGAHDINRCQNNDDVKSNDTTVTRDTPVTQSNVAYVDDDANATFQF